MSIFFNFLKKKSEYLITQKDIEKIAKRSFDNISFFLKCINKLADIKNNENYKAFTKKVINKMQEDFGIDSFLNKYKKEQLNNDNFKIMCIYSSCIERLVKKKISVTEYIVYKNLVESMVSENNSVSTDSFILNSFKVDPSILPVQYKQKIIAIDEFGLATESIILSLKTLNGPSGFTTYQDYYDYMFENSKKIINKLHDKGFYNTQDVERFTILCTAYKIGLPAIDTLYKQPGSSTSTSVNMPTEHLRQIQEQLFENNNINPGSR
jgi:hypothetical protein